MKSCDLMFIIIADTFSKQFCHFLVGETAVSTLSGSPKLKATQD